MTVKLRKSFIKDFNKLDSKYKKAWYRTLLKFRNDPRCKNLRRHKLTGKYKGLESIDIAPDLRALFHEDEHRFTFYYLKNHNQLYH